MTVRLKRTKAELIAQAWIYVECATSLASLKLARNALNKAVGYHFAGKQGPVLPFLHLTNYQAQSLFASGGYVLRKKSQKDVLAGHHAQDPTLFDVLVQGHGDPVPVCVVSILKRGDYRLKRTLWVKMLLKARRNY